MADEMRCVCSVALFAALAHQVAAGDLAVAKGFLPQDEALRRRAQALAELSARQEGLELVGW